MNFPITRNMRIQNALSSLTALAAIALVSSSQAAVIVNGSFEDPLVATGSFATYGNTSTVITGWVVVGFDASIVAGPFGAGPNSYQAQDGHQFIDLTGPGTNSSVNGISQSVATSVGQEYMIEFYVGSGTDFDTFTASTVDLSINGGTRISFTNPNTPTANLDWRLFSYNFTASGPVTDITFFNGSGPTNHLSALDNVTITAIPEPSAYAFMLGAMSLAGVVLRRRGVPQVSR